jgi:hypothetical protein
MSVVPVILSGRQAFDPRATLFAHNEPGVWYDPSDLGTMFTTSDGTTPVTAVEQAVGLILDKSRGLALGPELVTNGGFATDTDWTKGTDWSIGSGVATKTAGTAANLTQTIASTASRSYQCAATVTRTAGALTVSIGTSGTTAVFNASGTYTFYVTSGSSTQTLTFAADASFAGTIDNISVREIAGTHAIQPTAASRPVLRNRYNLLTYSEDLSNAAWVKGDSAAVTANAVTAPDGTTTADQIDFAASELSRVQQPITRISADYTLYLWLRTASGTASVRLGHSTSLTAITVTSTWQRFEVTVTTADPNYTLRNAAAGGAKTVYAWGADLRSANDTIYPYQRIEAATVYDSDTSKFPLYLACDGSDDSLYTAANLDLSATDKVSVFAGVTRLSDATVQIIAEFSAEESTNNGSFQLGRDLSASGNYVPFVRGTARNGRNYTTYTPPITNVLSASLTTVAADSAAAISFRVDGVVNAGANYLSNASTGNFGSYPLYIGRRNNASLPFNGRIQQLIVRGAASSAAEISSAERYIAGKQGRAL